MTKLKTLLAGLAAATVLCGTAVAQDVTMRIHQMLPAQATIPAKEAFRPLKESVCPALK